MATPMELEMFTWFSNFYRDRNVCGFNVLNLMCFIVLNGERSKLLKQGVPQVTLLNEALLFVWET